MPLAYRLHSAYILRLKVESQQNPILQAILFDSISKSLSLNYNYKQKVFRLCLFLAVGDNTIYSILHTYAGLNEYIPRQRLYA